MARGPLSRSARGAISVVSLTATVAAAVGMLAVVGRQIVERAAPAPASYALWGTNHDGTPIRWDPCGVVAVVVNPEGGPPGWEHAFADALERVEAASGLTLDVVGTTDELPGVDRPLADGDTWRPVLVAWVDPEVVDVPMGAADRAVAVPVAVGPPGDRTFVTGQVVFNRRRAAPDGWSPLAVDFEDRATSWGATMLHELGHLLGLDHVDDPTQLMHVHPVAGPVAFADGDLAGLEALGRGGCRPTSPHELDDSSA